MLEHHGKHLVPGGAGIGRRFEDHELSGPEGASDPLRGIRDVRQIGFLVPAQRGRHGDDDHVALTEPIEFGRRDESIAVGKILDHLVAEVSQVVLLGRDRVDLAFVDVEADRRHSAPVEGVGERKTDVPKADHPDDGGVVGDLGLQFEERIAGGRGLAHG